MNVLTINLVFSTFVFWIAARLYVLPGLGVEDVPSWVQRFAAAAPQPA